MINEIRVEVRIKNNLLYEAIVPIFGSIAEFSRRSGIGQGFIGDLINLKTSPFSSAIAQDSRLKQSMEHHSISSHHLQHKISKASAIGGWSKKRFEMIKKYKSAAHAHEYAIGRLTEKIRHRQARIYLPTAQRLAEICGYSCEDLFPIELYQSVTKNMVAATISLNKLFFFREQKMIAAGVVHEMIDEVSTPRKSQVDQALNIHLNKKERLIIEQRFGIGDKIEKTLQQVAKKIGVTRERVRQIEAKTIRRLRHPKLSCNLRDYA